MDLKKQTNKQKAWWTYSVNVSGFGPSLMRVIKSPYAENRKVNTDMYANWGLLRDVQAAASCLPTTCLPTTVRSPGLQCCLLAFLLPQGWLLLSVFAGSSSSSLT